MLVGLPTCECDLVPNTSRESVTAWPRGFRLRKPNREMNSWMTSDNNIRPSFRGLALPACLCRRGSLSLASETHK